MIEMTRKQIGNALRAARMKIGISQNRLGILSGVCVRNINFWESGGGDPPISAIIRIASTLGTTIDELVGISGNGEEEE